MLRLKKQAFTIGLLGLLAVAFATPSTAEARRYRRVVRRAVAAPVVVARPVVRRAVVAPAVVVRRPVVYSRGVNVVAPYTGVSVGYGGVSVAAPGVGVVIGY